MRKRVSTKGIWPRTQRKVFRDAAILCGSLLKTRPGVRLVGQQKLSGWVVDQDAAARGRSGLSVGLWCCKSREAGWACEKRATMKLERWFPAFDTSVLLFSHGWAAGHARGLSGAAAAIAVHSVIRGWLALNRSTWPKLAWESCSWDHLMRVPGSRSCCECSWPYWLAPTLNLLGIL